MIAAVYFFFNATANTEIYTLSLHDALPICNLQAVTGKQLRLHGEFTAAKLVCELFCRKITKIFTVHNMSPRLLTEDRKSTRLNSSHVRISYAVFCLKKKNNLMNCYSLYSLF